jgi:hypothetical protein
MACANEPTNGGAQVNGKELKRGFCFQKLSRRAIALSIRFLKLLYEFEKGGFG